MSSLDDLKYYLASRGDTPEQIAQAEQCAINASTASGCDVTYDLLTVLTLYNSPPAVQFRESMQKLVNEAGTSAQDLQHISAGILALAEETPAPTKKTEKTPYYHKDKGQWWK